MADTHVEGIRLAQTGVRLSLTLKLLPEVIWKYAFWTKAGFAAACAPVAKNPRAIGSKKTPRLKCAKGVLPMVSRQYLMSPARA